MYLLLVLWLKFILDLMFFELVSILFAIVPDYGNEYMTKENKHWTSFKILHKKTNLNNNIDQDTLSFFLGCDKLFCWKTIKKVESQSLLTFFFWIDGFCHFDPQDLHTLQYVLIKFVVLLATA